MKMKTLALILAAALLGGCPVQQGALDAPSDGRLAVNDHLREACSWMSDVEIESMLIAFEELRLSGVSKLDVISDFTAGCYRSEVQWGGTPDLTRACYSCGTIVIDQVYGR